MSMGTEVKVKQFGISFRDENGDHLIDLQSEVFGPDGEALSADDPKLAQFDQALQRIGASLSNGLRVPTLQQYVSILRADNSLRSNASLPIGDSESSPYFGFTLTALEYDNVLSYRIALSK